MAKALLTIEVIGKDSFLKLRKTQDDDPVIKIGLLKRRRPELSGLECNLKEQDLSNFKGIKEGLLLVLQRPPID
jgi:hypothetical protein